MPYSGLSNIRPLFPETPLGLMAIADHFQVSLHSAAVRLRDLGFWRRSVGMWTMDQKPRQLWFVGRRPWTSSKQTFDVFGEAMERRGPIEARELCWVGGWMQSVSLSVLNIGKGRLLATIV
jgi:hypothetical protein